MSGILFVNACPRPGSRTLELARAVLAEMGGQAEEIDLFREDPLWLTGESLCRREQLVKGKEFSHPALRHAVRFAQAEEIVIAAPYWDLLFPAVLRGYLEAVTVSGVTFVYGENGAPRGLCRAKRLIYVTTAGGPIVRNFGFEYVDALAKNFYGIPETECIVAEGLDIWGANVEQLLGEVKRELRKKINKEDKNNVSCDGTH